MKFQPSLTSARNMRRPQRVLELRFNWVSVLLPIIWVFRRMVLSPIVFVTVAGSPFLKPVRVKLPKVGTKGPVLRAQAASVNLLPFWNRVTDSVV